MTYYKFVKWEAQPIENCLSGTIPAALQEYDNGNKKPFHDLQIATTDPYYKIGGWCFPLAPLLGKNKILWYFGILRSKQNRYQKRIEKPLYCRCGGEIMFYILCILILPVVILAELLKLNK